jgi:hypothetical protein
MAGYMSGRYGGPIGAASHERSFNWYGGGLRNGLFTRPTLIGVGDRGPELVNVTPGRGGGRVVLEIRSSGSHVDNFIAEAVRRSARVHGGGDVQVAFGSSH